MSEAQLFNESNSLRIILFAPSSSRLYRLALYLHLLKAHCVWRKRKGNCLVGNTFRLGYTFRMQQKLYPQSPLSGMNKKLKRGKGPTDVYSLDIEITRKRRKRGGRKMAWHFSLRQAAAAVRKRADGIILHVRTKKSERRA